MGWICITDNCLGHISSSGMWDGTGIAFFSISDEVTILHDVFFNFLMNMSPGVYVMALFILVLSLFVSIMVSIKRAIKDVSR